VSLALSGKSIPGGIIEKALISNFEILNLVPTYGKIDDFNGREESKKAPTISAKKLESPESTKWRRVGLVLGRKVHLDTIVWYARITLEFLNN
jgi:hypothetical protein